MLKTLTCGIAALALTALGTEAAKAQWPERPVEMLVAYGAGGGTDTLARIIAEYLTDEIGQPVVVVNKPGAGGTIGANAAANADPDGYTMYMMATGHTIAAAVYGNLPYDAVTDFDGITQVAQIPYIFLANPDFEAKSLDDLIAMAKEKPGEFTFGSVGVGSSQHFAGELLKETAGIDLLHIPYQKTPEALAALLSGEIDVLVEVVAPMIGQVKSGDVRALAVTTADRHPALPDVPTVAESGHDYEVAGWYGVSFPDGTDPAIVSAANAAFANVLGTDEVKQKLLGPGYVANTMTPEEFDAFLANEVARWTTVRENAGIPAR